MKKVVIIQRIIPHYRITFFKRLYESLLKENIKLQVLHSSKNIKNNEFFVYLKPTYEKEIYFLSKTKVVISFKLFKYLKEISPNLILTEDISNLPNSLIVLVYSKLNNVKYGIIGLGKVLNKKESILKKILKLPIDYFRKNASFFIAYSSVGASYYEKLYNKKTISWNNSVIDVPNIDINSIKKKYLQKKLNILYIGRIEKFKKVDLLIEALNEIKNENIELNIIGDGDELNNLKIKYKNVNFKINWLGKITEQKVKEKYIRQAHLGVMPGSGGLVIQELQSYAVPVIASYSDGTEIDLIKNVNPELFMEKSDKQILKSKILEFINYDLEKKVLIAQRAYNVTKEKYNLSAMVNSTVNIIKEEISKISG